MRTNALADNIHSILSGIHERTYKNKAIQNAVFPYVVCNLESVTSSYPSEDYYLNVNVYDKPNVLSRNIEDLSDAIDNSINHQSYVMDGMTFQIEREQRQYIPSEELTTAQATNLRYAVRVYFS